MQSSPSSAAASSPQRSRCAPHWLVPALLLLGASAATAEQLPGAFEQGDLGAQRFSQTDGFSPICCGERDEWASWGPTVRVGAGWRFKAPVSLKLDVQFATGDLASEGVKGSLQKIGAALGMDWHLMRGPFEPLLGLGVTGLAYFGDRTEPIRNRTVRVSGELFGAQVRGGARYWATAHFAVGADVRLTAYMFSNQAVDVTLGITYAGL